MNRGIAVAGDIIVDIIKTIKQFPVRHGLVKISDLSYSLGGAVCSTGMDLAILDPSLTVSLVGVVGEDGDGDQVLKRFGQYPNIDTSRIVRSGKTAFTDVLTEQDDGARSFLVYNESNDRFCQEHVDIENLNCDIFHIGYILLLDALDQPDEQYGTKMARLLHDVQAAGILTSVDVVSEVGNRHARLVPPALRYTDYFIVNEIESGATSGIELRGPNGVLRKERIPDVLMALRKMGVKRWIIIHAPEGGFGLDENDRYVERESLKLPEGFIKGTVGAGDAFCAGALLAAYRGASIERAIDDGNAAAACSLRELGATEGMRRIEEVRAFAKSLGDGLP